MFSFAYSRVVQVVLNESSMNSMRRTNALRNERRKMSLEGATGRNRSPEDEAGGTPLQAAAGGNRCPLFFFFITLEPRVE